MKCDPVIGAKLMEIVNRGTRFDRSATPSINDFRKKPTYTRTDAQEKLITLQKQKRALRIQSNGYTSTGRNVPASLQQQIDDVSAQIKELK